MKQKKSLIVDKPIKLMRPQSIMFDIRKRRINNDLA